MKKLIITADDFGLCTEVNQAVVQAHTQGILTCASLMMGEAATDEAIRLAKQNPTLKIGLHLVLVEGHSVLPKKEIPDLVDEEGRFSNRIFLSGIRYFFSKKLKLQIEKECEAQILKFLAAGLKIDHLNGHNHLHIHPTISNIVIRLAKKYSISAIRLPYSAWHYMVMMPWVIRMRQKLRRAKITFNDATFGLCETGNMVEEAWLKMIPKIKTGLTEVYCHPATQTTGVLKETTPNYQHALELKALLSPVIKKALEEEKIERISFSDL